MSSLARYVDKVAIVTGAGAGIGRATAERLVGEGARVAVVDRDRDAAEEVADGLGDRAFAVVADLEDADQVASMVAAAAAEFGRVDVLVNNAGIAVGGSVTSLELDDWTRVVNVNLRSIWLAMKHAMPHLAARGGAIVNMASVQGLMGFPGWAGYAATKGGILALTRQAAVEYAKDGVRVNSVAPGTIMTPMNQRIFAEAREPETLRAAWGAMHALGRFGEPEEVAAAIAFLASDDASFITGACLPVDGGLTILGPSADAS
ncbi:SDR family oxidoreductase [soil metagenome]